MNSFGVCAINAVLKLGSTKWAEHVARMDAILRDA
jgi:hypothetical protein